jgi:hypothetical protein
MRMRTAAALASASGLAILASTVSGPAQGLGHAYLFAFGVAFALTSGALFLVGLHHVTGGVWWVGYRRVAESVAGLSRALPLLLLPVLAAVVWAGEFRLFPWLGADAEPLHQKAAYLNAPFFVARQLVFVVGLALWARFFLRHSQAMEEGSDGPSELRRLRRAAPPFLIFFALVVTFGSFDLFMSLDPEWYSTIFGVYVFAGMFQMAFAAVAILVVGLGRMGALPREILGKDHLYNLGGWLFATSCFWAYVAFSQFMLIWYGHLPEETAFYHRRIQGGWLAVSLLVPALRFGVPFLVLLGRKAKMDPTILSLVGVVTLLGGILDIAWLVLPEAGPSGPGLGPVVGFLLLILGGLGLLWTRTARSMDFVPRRDPGWARCKEFRL